MIGTILKGRVGSQIPVQLRDHLDALSRDGDPLEVVQQTVGFEYFRSWQVGGLGYGNGANVGWPPFEPVMMFKALVLQAQHNLSDARMEFMSEIA